MGQVVCRLAELLHYRGITVAQFAKQTGLGFNTVKRLCENPTAVEFETLAKICDALNCSISELLAYQKDGVFIHDRQWDAVVYGRVVEDLLQEKVAQQNHSSRCRFQELVRQMKGMIEDYLAQEQQATEEMRLEILRLAQRAVGFFSEQVTGENVADTHERMMQRRQARRRESR
ncbi:MAG: helix-turn-helix transcriptional regulator [Gloeomargarita sp. SKYG116]|nr:helix-turn-helix transcriptional regulator [Gloeomargarita sp. SKYG116]MCS7226745.1 helix-turn-helix transcriptional regulator [Gloeomargarita sp. SKYB31]MDW8401966.1 helix-turn-helix transcriptional regulator [Gloeomargarita sp. SKYGB_i_bin116]